MGPVSSGPPVGLFQISSRKAFDTGWTQRPFEETAGDYLWSYDDSDLDRDWRDELSPEVEEAVLDRWEARRR